MTSNEENSPERPGLEGVAPVDREAQSDRDAEPYDATRDPRTGRPPNPLEAQRLAREHEQERLAEQNEEIPGAEPGMASPDDVVEEEGEPNMSPVAAGQPPRMASPHADDDETPGATGFAEDGSEKSDGRQTESI
jgi:hypothetical protein